MKLGEVRKNLFCILILVLLTVNLMLLPCCNGGENRGGKFVVTSPSIGNLVTSPSIEGQGEKVDNLEILYQKGKDAQESYDLNAAEKIYIDILSKDPHHYKARKRLGEVYYMIGEYEPAIREFKKALEENPPNAEAIKSNLVLCYLAVDRPENALKYISPEIDKYSRWGTHYSFLAQARYSQYLLAGSTEEKKGILKTLKTELKEGISKAPSGFGRAMLQSSLALFEGKWQEVRAHLKTALGESEPGKDRISISFLLGALESRLGNSKKSAEYFNAILSALCNSQAIDPTNLMDGIYSIWALHNIHKGAFLTIEGVNSIVGQVRGGIKEPETQDFLKFLEEYIKAQNLGKSEKALESLKQVERLIKDESIEGDFFYDAIYKPFILSLLYDEMANVAEKTKEKSLVKLYKRKAETALKKNFP